MFAKLHQAETNKATHKELKLAVDDPRRSKRGVLNENPVQRYSMLKHFIARAGHTMYSSGGPSERVR